MADSLAVDDLHEYNNFNIFLI